MRAWLLALAMVLVAAGCLGGNAPAETDVPVDTPTRTDNATVEDVAFNFSGRIGSATPATPFTEDFAFDVPQGAIGVQATLTWQGAGSDLRLTLLDPRGESAGSGFPEKAGQRSVATVDPPASGAWKARITSTRAVDQAFEVAVVVSLLQPQNNTLRDKLDMAAGTFAEVNLIMEKGAVFNWSFASSAGDPVEWNIHSHENGETTYHKEGADVEYAGAFTAKERHIYSIMWENVGPATTLTYEVTGAFRVHSHSQ